MPKVTASGPRSTFNAMRWPFVGFMMKLMANKGL